MESTLINTPKLVVTVRTGQEGPKHDPYSFVEYEAEMPTTSLEAHLGLGFWVRTNGGPKINITGWNYDRDEQFLNDLFRHATGYTIRQLIRFRDAAKSRCTAGGRHNTIPMNGFPGESFEVCTKCNRVVDSFFDHASIA